MWLYTSKMLTIVFFIVFFFFKYEHYRVCSKFSCSKTITRDEKKFSPKLHMYTQRKDSQRRKVKEINDVQVQGKMQVT